MKSSDSVNAFRVFFPAAAFYAGLAVPLSVYAVLSGSGFPQGLIGTGHGHEMLFGFALALIAGYTLGPTPRSRLIALFVLWLAARLSYLLLPHSMIASLLSPLFGLAVAYYVVPRFRAAKKWRNKVAGPLLLILCLLPAVWILLPYWRYLSYQQLMVSAILLLAMLMMFMGGRLIAPAAAGALQKQGITLEARVQPRLEATLILLLAGAALSSFVLPLRNLTAILLITASVILAIRLARWQLWRCRARPDLIGLGVGYLWLAIGLFAAGLSMLLSKPMAGALHLITVGALGSLSTGVMMRLHFQRRDRQPPPDRWVWFTLALIALAAISRYSIGALPFHHSTLLWGSALCWMAAFCVLGCLLLRTAPVWSSPNGRSASPVPRQ